MKKILVVMSTLYNGGAERSLVNFLNELPQDKYEIDLLLFKREGMFMKQLPSYVKVLDTPKELKQLYGSVKKAGALMPVKVIGTAAATALTKNSREKRGFRWKYFYGPRIPQMKEKYDLAIAYISGEILYFLSPLKPDFSRASPNVLVLSRMLFDAIISSYLNLTLMSSGR